MGKEKTENGHTPSSEHLSLRVHLFNIAVVEQRNFHVDFYVERKARTVCTFCVVVLCLPARNINLGKGATYF